MTQRIAIIGASKGIGLATVKEALARGHVATGLARNPPAYNQPSLTWVSGDVQNPAALTKALAGATVVITTLGVSGTGETTVLSAAARTVTAAMTQAGIQRLIAVTGFGAGDSRGHGGFMFDKIIFPLAMGKLYADKDREEAIVRETNLNWTLVRPVRLTDGPKASQIESLTSKYRGGTISRADVASFLLDCAEQGSFVKQAPVILSK